MINHKKVCGEEEKMMGGSSFEEDTFRHLLAEKRTIIVNNLIVDNMIERIVLPIININEMDDEIEAESKSFNRDETPIKIFINTNGGTATEVFSCISAIEESTTPVWTYAMGKAFSGGFYLLLAGHRRFCQKYSTLMYHQIQTGLPHGDMKTSMEHIDETVRMQELFNEFILRRSKIKPKVLLDVNAKKLDWYMGAGDALKLGVVDDCFY
jgi:ATP-dependent Clp protease protease subunit